MLYLYTSKQKKSQTRVMSDVDVVTTLSCVDPKRFNSVGQMARAFVYKRRLPGKHAQRKRYIQPLNPLSADVVLHGEAMVEA
jgi:hypothetical protein